MASPYMWQWRAGGYQPPSYPQYRVMPYGSAFYLPGPQPCMQQPNACMVAAGLAAVAPYGTPPWSTGDVGRAAAHPTWTGPPPAYQYEDPPLPASRNLQTGQRPGQQYLYPEHHADMNVVTDGTKPWLRAGAKFRVENFKVPCTMTVQEVIMAFGGDKKSVITEFVEQGDGKWSKGQTIRYDSKEAEDRIGVWGWGGTRGSVTAPVWVVVYPTARG